MKHYVVIEKNKKSPICVYASVQRHLSCDCIKWWWTWNKTCLWILNNVSFTFRPFFDSQSKQNNGGTLPLISRFKHPKHIYYSKIEDNEAIQWHEVSRAHAFNRPHPRRTTASFPLQHCFNTETQGFPCEHGGDSQTKTNMCKTIFLWSGSLANAKLWPEGCLEWNQSLASLWDLHAVCWPKVNWFPPAGLYLPSQCMTSDWLVERDGLMARQTDQSAGWLSHRLLPFQPGLSPLFPFATILIKHLISWRKVSILLFETLLNC